MEWPHMLSAWLMAQGIDPERVSVVLQVGDADTAERIGAGFERELDRSFLAPDTLHTQVIKYCGLAIEVRLLCGAWRADGESAGSQPKGE